MAPGWLGGVQVMLVRTAASAGWRSSLSCFLSAGRDARRMACSWRPHSARTMSQSARASIICVGSRGAVLQMTSHST